MYDVNVPSTRTFTCESRNELHAFINCAMVLTKRLNFYILRRTYGCKLRNEKKNSIQVRQYQSRNSPGFDPSIHRHSGIWGAADEAMLKNVHCYLFLPRGSEQAKKHLLKHRRDEADQVFVSFDYSWWKKKTKSDKNQPVLWNRNYFYGSGSDFWKVMFRFLFLLLTSYGSSSGYSSGSSSISRP